MTLVSGADAPGLSAAGGELWDWFFLPPPEALGFFSLEEWLAMRGGVFCKEKVGGEKLPARFFRGSIVPL